MRPGPPSHLPGQRYVYRQWVGDPERKKSRYFLPAASCFQNWDPLLFTGNHQFKIKYPTMVFSTSPSPTPSFQMPNYVLHAPLKKIGNEVQSVNELIKINITTDAGSLYGHKGDEAIPSMLTALYRHDGQKTIGKMHPKITLMIFCQVFFTSLNIKGYVGTEVGVAGTTLSGDNPPQTATTNWFTAITGQMKTFGEGLLCITSVS